MLLKTLLLSICVYLAIGGIFSLLLLLANPELWTEWQVVIPLHFLLPLGGYLLFKYLTRIKPARPSKPVSIDPKDLSNLSLSLSQLEERKLGPRGTCETIDVPLLDTSTRRCLQSIVESGFLTSDDVSKLELAARNLGVAVSSNEGDDSSYLAELALLVNRALKVAGR